MPADATWPAIYRLSSSRSWRIPRAVGTCPRSNRLAPNSTNPWPEMMNLPEEPAGSPFPPSEFVAQETTILSRQRVTLLESEPSFAEL